MAQAITPEDVHRGTFHRQTCTTQLRVFYHRHCPKCHAEFTLLSAMAQREQAPEKEQPLRVKLKNFFRRKNRTDS